MTQFLNRELETQKVSGRTLLDRFCVIDESSRKSPAYLDPNYSGFYYHLGKMIHPESVLEMGFDLGLLVSSLMISCKTVRRFVGFQEASAAFSTRIGIKNVGRVMKGAREFHVGSLYDAQFEAMLRGGVDMCLVTAEKNYDKHLEYLDFVWPLLSENGLLAVEGLTRNPASGQAFAAFCKSKNRKPATFRTRYGSGLIQK